MSYVIYKICCDDVPDFIYIGSTKAFRQRKRQHKCDCRPESQHKNIKLYKTINENGGWENWRMVILEECGNISLTEARIKEEKHRLSVCGNLNSRKCFGDKQEYNTLYKKTNEQYKKRQKEYYQQTVICNCGLKIQQGNRGRHIQTKVHNRLLEEKEL